jgi:predicted nucleic acid-binding protein
VKAYVDTSALLRLILREPGALAELRSCDGLIASELVAVESFRTLDRLRLGGSLSPEEAADRGVVVATWLNAFDLVLLRSAVLTRAGEPLPTPLGTLDALHLASALVWRDRMGEPLTMATHDAALASAARAFKFEVIGA